MDKDKFLKRLDKREKELKGEFDKAMRATQTTRMAVIGAQLGELDYIREMAKNEK